MQKTFANSIEEKEGEGEGRRCWGCVREEKAMTPTWIVPSDDTTSSPLSRKAMSLTGLLCKL